MLLKSLPLDFLKRFSDIGWRYRTCNIHGNVICAARPCRRFFFSKWALKFHATTYRLQDIGIDKRKRHVPNSQRKVWNPYHGKTSRYSSVYLYFFSVTVFIRSFIINASSVGGLWRRSIRNYGPPDTRFKKQFLVEDKLLNYFRLLENFSF